MSILTFGWFNLRFSEKLIIMASVVIATLMSYQAMNLGHDAISGNVIGPLLLMAFGLHSMFVVGILRGRGRAMNYMFIEVLKELRDAKKEVGKEVSPEISRMIAGFLGE